MNCFVLDSETDCETSQLPSRGLEASLENS
jgi:hypothetical protein